jgi:tetratricopeptide (TPR) repeat protein
MRENRGKTIDRPLDSMASVYFYPEVTRKFNSIVASTKIPVDGLKESLKIYTDSLEKVYRKKAYHHWLRTLDIECTYHNSYEKLKEWNTKLNNYDSSISVNTKLLSCRNYKSADALWNIAYGYKMKGDTAKAMETYEKMLVIGFKLVTRYKTVINHMSKAGNSRTSTSITNNFYASATSINQVLDEMLLYYSSANKNEDVKRIQSLINQLPLNAPVRY